MKDLNYDITAILNSSAGYRENRSHNGMIPWVHTGPESNLS